jgi:hypothetical protein
MGRNILWADHQAGVKKLISLDGLLFRVSNESPFGKAAA